MIIVAHATTRLFYSASMLNVKEHICIFPLHLWFSSLTPLSSSAAPTDSFNENRPPGKASRREYVSLLRNKKVFTQIFFKEESPSVRMHEWENEERAYEGSLRSQRCLRCLSSTYWAALTRKPPPGPLDQLVYNWHRYSSEHKHHSPLHTHNKHSGSLDATHTSSNGSPLISLLFCTLRLIRHIIISRAE